MPAEGGAVERPVRFEEFRYLGDKRTQVVHDLDRVESPEVVEELLASEAFTVFAPDTLAEARNRGYRPAQRSAGPPGDDD